MGSNTEEYHERNYVKIIRANDVLLGRGSRSNQPGNVKFRHFIKDNRYRYLAASKIDKPKIAEDVVRMWRELDPPGRFLSRKDEDEVEGNSDKKDEHAVWFDVGDKKARLKTSMALRERTPDAVQYLQMIRQKEAEATHRDTNYVKQQLGMHDPYSGHRYQEEPTHHHHNYPPSFNNEPPMYPMHTSSRRASFAGFPQGRVDDGMHHFHYQPSTMHPSTAPSRRSSLMGERQAQLYMMHQQVEAQRRRIEREIRMEDHSERLESSGYCMPMPHPSSSGGHLPSIPDQRESDHSTEDPVTPRVSPTMPIRAVTNESVPRDAPSVISSDSVIPASRARMIPQRESRTSKTGNMGHFFDDFRPSKVAAFEDSDEADDAIIVEKYRNLLQGWADREKQTIEEPTDVEDMESIRVPRRRGVDRAVSGCSIDIDEDMESIRAPRRRGVDRAVSGCSVQSTLSDLMAMSIISTGTEEDCFGLDVKSVSSEMVSLDD